MSCFVSFILLLSFYSIPSDDDDGWHHTLLTHSTLFSSITTYIDYLSFSFLFFSFLSLPHNTIKERGWWLADDFISYHMSLQSSYLSSDVCLFFSLLKSSFSRKAMNLHVSLRTVKEYFSNTIVYKANHQYVTRHDSNSNSNTCSSLLIHWWDPLEKNSSSLFSFVLSFVLFWMVVMSLLI